jgi:Family of unknown function (DUF6515)/Bacterial SH3 domain
MKNSRNHNLISSILLVSLVCSGLILFGSRPASADNDDQRYRNHERWEQQESQQQTGEFRKERKQQQEAVAKTRQPAKVVVRQKSRQAVPNKQPVIVERRTVTREIKREVQHKRPQDNHAARRPVVRTVSRPTVTRERSVVRNVSRPNHRSEVRDYRRLSKIQRPVVRHNPRQEVIVKILPRGSKTVVINRERLYAHGGHYYRHTPRGYLLVRPPLGALIAELPFGFLRVTFGGLDYFVWDNVFYRHTPLGYRVVETPVGYQETDYGPVRVEAALLNIRSGPGLEFEVIGRLEQGNLLMVTAISPEWYYALLPNGDYGWVMSRHTSPVANG